MFPYAWRDVVSCAVPSNAPLDLAQTPRLAPVIADELRIHGASKRRPSHARHQSAKWQSADHRNGPDEQDAMQTTSLNSALHPARLARAARWNNVRKAAAGASYAGHQRPGLRSSSRDTGWPPASRRGCSAIHCATGLRPANPSEVSRHRSCSSGADIAKSRPRSSSRIWLRPAPVSILQRAGTYQAPTHQAGIQ